MATKPKLKAKDGSTSSTGSDPKDDPVYESTEKVDKDEEAHCKDLLRRISNAKTARKHFDEVMLPKLRRITYGIQASASGDTREPAAEGSEISSVRTNLVFSTQATLLPHIYARNPEIAVTPTEAVGEGEYETIKAFTETAQSMLNRCFVEETRLKQRVKANIRSTMTTSVGWLKMGWQESYRGDALIVRRINDIQDNLARIDATSMTLKASSDIEEQKALREKLLQEKKAVEESNEISVFKGFVIDRCSTEDVLVVDETVREFDDYEHADALAMRVFMSDAEYKARYGRKPWKGASEYPAAKVSGQESELGVSGSREAQKTVQGERYRCIWEVWSIKDGRVYTLCEGANAYVRPPFTPSALPKRWHMLWALGFNIVEGRWRPLSDVELLMHLQAEYDQTRYLYAEARKEAIPVRVFRRGGELDEEDVEALVNRKARQFIGVKGSPTIPIAQDIMQLDGVKIDPAAYDVTLIRNDMDMVVGLSDASRSNLIQAKTATEAQIMQQALANRVAERQDTIEDMISDMAEAALQIMLQKFTLDEVKEIVGEGAVWPENVGPELWHKIRVKVRAGSSGKPNQAKEREDWGQLMPVIKETMKQVSELRAAGQHDMANAAIELLKETLHRFDERIDVDRFIPRDAQQEGAPDVGEMTIKMQQQEQMLAELQQQLQMAQEELQKAKAQEQAKVVEIQANQAAEQQRAEKEAELKLAQERTRAAEAQAKAAIETAKTSADEAVQKAQVLSKAAVDLITKLGIVPGTSGVEGPMADLIDSASIALQNVMDGKASLRAGGRAAQAPEGEAPEADDAEPAVKRMRIRGPDGGAFDGEVTRVGKIKTIMIRRPDGQVYSGTIEE